jgi:hypothetical protein
MPTFAVYQPHRIAKSRPRSKRLLGRGAAMSELHAIPTNDDAATSSSDALVFFGATGDLAFKKIFPALQSMVLRRNLDIPIIGVAFSNWTV